MTLLNKAIVAALCDAAHDNRQVSVMRDDGRWFIGVAEELKTTSTGLVLLLWTDEGYKSVKADRVSSVTLHAEVATA